MKNLRTPIVKPRPTGGTFYTFGSALEDVGLNINELNNKVAMSHYVLLNLPSWSDDSGESNPDNSFADYFQNYALNLETLIRNQRDYNFAEKLTVSERVFWKFLRKYFGFTVAEDNKGNLKETSEHKIVQGFGAISAGAQRTDDYGIYNETYVQIPSSYGQMDVFFKHIINDQNYAVGNTFTATGATIENVPEEEISDNTIIATGISATARCDDEDKYEIGENDNICVEFSLDELRKIFNDDKLIYDDIATTYNTNESFEFNAVLVYYSIYDSDTADSQLLATNAYGILLLNSAVSDGGEFAFPTIEKKASNSGNIGNSYAFRLNIKTTSTYNTNITLNDNSTGSYEMSLEFNDMLKNLAVCVDILRSNNKLISLLVTENIELKQMLIQTIDKVDRLEETINGKEGIKARLKTIEDSDIFNSSVVNIETGETGGEPDEEQSTENVGEVIAINDSF